MLPHGLVWQERKIVAVRANAMGDGGLAERLFIFPARLELIFSRTDLTELMEYLAGKEGLEIGGLPAHYVDDVESWITKVV